MSQEATVQVPASFVKNCTDFIGSAGQFAQSQRAKQAAFDSKANDVLNKLVSLGIIDANLQTKVAERIREDPAHVFTVLEKVANFARPNSVGGPSDTEPKKRASTAENSGRPRTAADEAFEARMASVG